MKQTLQNTLAILGMCAAASVAQASEGNYFFLKGELYRGANLVSVFSAPLENTEGLFDLETRSSYDVAKSAFSDPSAVDTPVSVGRQEANYRFYVTLKEKTGGTANIGLGVRVSEGFRPQRVNHGLANDLHQTFDLTMNTGLFLWRDVPVELPLGACAGDKGDQGDQGDQGCYRIVLEMSSGSNPKALKKVAAKK
ncbi:hypothetical protein [Pseudomonas amygdali]|uniref:Uncharacterized protein n=1 Tax=Pseudomonas amygdali pv. lachrymans str. M301315 TaxID=629260 RepID=A0AAD0PVT3_PSEAV|nr:hypothetical protein [Pseudomonas amygdali]AXH59667.1 hypothetical protein PLA107_031065 [Pseudomonas amygdali pv. lachrymans str. M301315]RMT05934.1 hypothetical protein ALP54_03576 [Pseudomonas amygdali pv. lachrymans]